MSQEATARASCTAPIPVLLMARQLGWGGGIERDVSKLARTLPEHGVEPHVACFVPGGTRWREIESAGIPVLAVPVKSFKSWSAVVGARILWRYVAEQNIRVLHCFDFATDVYGVPLGRMLGVPITLSSQLWQREAQTLQTRLMLAAVDRVATGLFVNANAIAQDLASNWKVPADRIHVCHNGFEPQEFHPYERKRPEELADASIVIGAVSVFREEKNLLDLVEAFSRISTLDRRVRLVLVGDGPMKSAIEQRIQSLGLGQSCLLADATPKPADWMRAIDVFVVASRSEAFPNALLEAMACGCCPVASRVGGIPELVADGERGFLFEAGNVAELADALGSLVRDPSRCWQIGQKAASFVRENFTIDIAASRLAGIYRQLLSAKGFGSGHRSMECAESVGS